MGSAFVPLARSVGSGRLPIGRPCLTLRRLLATTAIDGKSAAVNSQSLPAPCAVPGIDDQSVVGPSAADDSQADCAEDTSAGSGRPEPVARSKNRFGRPEVHLWPEVDRQLQIDMGLSVGTEITQELLRKRLREAFAARSGRGPHGRSSEYCRAVNGEQDGL